MISQILSRESFDTKLFNLTDLTPASKWAQKLNCLVDFRETQIKTIHKFNCFCGQHHDPFPNLNQRTKERNLDNR